MFNKKIPAAGAVTAIHYGDSFGPAVQLGANYNLGSNWFANVDAKRIWIKSRVDINNGAVIADVHLDPWIVGGGVGYRF
jgi:outer membrane protein